MKKILLIPMILCILVGCNKDKPKTPNEVTFGSEKFTIAWAGVYIEPDDRGYCFGVSATVPDGPLFLEPKFFEVDLAPEMLGVKLDWSINYNCPTWMNYGYFGWNVNITEESIDGIYYFYEGDESLTPDENWVKITPLTQPNHYLFEFSMTIDGKTLTGYYSGKFAVKENYEDVGAFFD